MNTSISGGNMNKLSGFYQCQYLGCDIIPYFYKMSLLEESVHRITLYYFIQHM